MSSLKLTVSLLLLAACTHDLDELAPSSDDAHAWIGEEVDDACESCITTRCKPQVSDCIAEESCHSTFADCYPPNPSCGTVSPVHYAFGTCVNVHCDSACNFEQKRFDCIGQYTWPDPPENVEVHFTVHREAFEGGGGPDDKTLPALVEVCFGAECKVESSATVATGASVDLYYRWLPLTRRQPYLRVSGEGLQPMLVYEDLPIPQAYFFPIVVQSRDQYVGLHYLLGLTPDAKLGTLNALLIGCVASPTPGIRFELEQGGAAVTAGVRYFYDGESLLKPPAVEHTISPGLFGGFAQLPPGSYDLFAIEASTNRRVGVARSVLVQADTLTHVSLMALSSGE